MVAKKTVKEKKESKETYVIIDNNHKASHVMAGIVGYASSKKDCIAKCNEYTTKVPDAKIILRKLTCRGEIEPFIKTTFTF